jgi:hypothetical protein
MHERHALRQQPLLLVSALRTLLRCTKEKRPLLGLKMLPVLRQWRFKHPAHLHLDVVGPWLDEGEAQPPPLLLRLRACWNRKHDL